MVESEFNNVSGEDPDTDWDVDDAWEMNDGFDSEIFYTLSNKGNQHRNVVIYTWRFLHPKQRVGYFDDKKNVDPNFGLKGGKYLCEEKTVIPVTLSEKMEKPEVVLQLECPEFLMESKKIEIRISLKDFIQPRNVGYEL